MENVKVDQLQIEEVQLDNEVKQQFGEAAKWSKFVAVVVFVFLGIFLVIAIIGSSALLTTFGRFSDSFGSLMGLGSGILIAVILLVLATVGVLYYFLHRFAIKVKLAIQSEDQIALTQALNALKIFFVITTVFTAISLAASFFGLFKQ